jgi:hypothetical protein
LTRSSLSFKRNSWAIGAILDNKISTQIRHDLPDSNIKVDHMMENEFLSIQVE